MKVEAIDLNLLLVLHHVLATQSVSRAAESLHVTPAAVSNSLARLRELLGDPLVVRRGRGITLTPAAVELAPRLNVAIASLRDIVEGGVAFHAKRCARRFTVASADNLNPDVLPRIVRACAVELPKAELRIVSLDQAVAMDSLASGEVDALLGIPPESQGVRTVPAYAEKLVCVAADRVFRQRTLSLEQFLARRHVAVVLHGKYPIDMVDDALATQGLRRDIALSVPLFTTAAACVSGTPYLAMMPARMANQLGGPYGLRVFRSPVELPSVQILLAWHERSDADRASLFFRQVILQSLDAKLDA